MKNTTVCRRRVRSRLVWSRGRISSMEAPVVPTAGGENGPHREEDRVDERGGDEIPAEHDAPEITKSPARSTMKET